MTTPATERPADDEHIPYYGQYIRLVPDGDIVETLTRQIDETIAVCRTLTTNAARARPAPGEWNALEIIGHLVDVERVFVYRALRIARADRTFWEDIDFDAYVATSEFAAREMGSLFDEFEAVRGATLALLDGLGAEAWARRMPETWTLRSVRAIAWILAGHELRHRPDLRR